MEAVRGVGTPGRRTVGVRIRPSTLAVAVALAIGLTGCGGGGGGGGGNGNVRPTSPPAPPVGSGGFTGGQIDVNGSDATTLSTSVTGSVDLIKGGTGALTLTGTNSYTGVTRVDAGSLYVNGNQSAAKGVTTVASGATLGGAGILGGDVDIASGATLSPGAMGGLGTLTVNGSLRLASGSILDYGFAQPIGMTQYGDLIYVKGNLTLDGILNVGVASGGDLGPGVHRLIEYDGSLVDNGLTPTNMPSAGWIVQTGVAHQVNLIDTRGMSFGFWDGDAGPQGNDAVDGGDGTWVAGTGRLNWTDASGAVNAAYGNGSFAVFQGTPGTVTVSGANGSVTAAGMQFASDGYVVRGDTLRLVGSVADPTHSIVRVGDGTSESIHTKATIESVIDGSTTLVKTDNGKLALTGENTYTGGTTVNAGVLQIGDGGATGSILGNVTNNSVFAFNRSDDVTYNNIVSGIGTLVQSGTGKLILTGANTYSGGTTVAAGTLEVAVGAIPGFAGITVGNDDLAYGTVATLQVDHGVTLSNDLWVEGHGVLDNAGVVGGNTAIGVNGGGNYLSSNPTVFNHDGGVIRAMQAGVGMYFSVGTVKNSSGGLIEAPDAGVDLGLGGQVANDGPGSIIRSVGGIAVRSSGLGSVKNTGGGTIVGTLAGIQLQQGGAVTNDGVGSAIRSPSGKAIEATGATATINNTGGATISSPGTALYLRRGGSVTNTAGSTIESTGPAGDCSAMGNCAIYVESDSHAPFGSGSLTLANAGVIIGNVKMSAYANNTVTLTAGGAIRGDLDIGSLTPASLTLRGTPGVVQLYSEAVTGKTTFVGNLSGPGAGTWVIDNDDLKPGSVTIGGGALRIGNGGTTGSLGQGSEVAIYGGSLVFDRSDDITFNGSISSMHSEAYNGTLVQAGTGALTLVLGSNDIAPTHITIERGTLRFDNTGNQPGSDVGSYPLQSGIVNNGSLVFDSRLNIFAGMIAGTGSVTQDGSAALILQAPNTYTGQTTVNKGSIMASYVLPGDATVNAAGLLDGYTGATPRPGLPGVAGNLTNAGKVAVHGGNTLVGGNYSQSPTGTLAVSLGSKLAVDGTATLAGGTLEITGKDSGYVYSTHTPVLTATSGLTGTFDALVKDAGVVFTATTVNYDGNSAWLDTTGLNVTTAAAGNGVTYTPNSLRSAQRVQAAFTQLNTAMASGVAPAVSSDFVQAAGEFQQAPGLQAAQASLQSLSGQLHAASAAMTFEAIDASSRALADHFDDLSGKRTAYGMWTQNLSVGGDMGRSGYDGVGFQLNGWLVGNDRQIGNSGVAGFAFGQSQGRQQLDQSYDHNRSRSTEGMLYAGWLNGAWYSQGRVGFGHFQQDVSRRLLLGTTAQAVSTNYSGNYTMAYGESGLHLDWAGTRILPFASAEYARIDRGGFAEDGAGGFGLRAHAQTLDRWQAGVGLRAARHWSFTGDRGIDARVSARFRRTVASRGDAFDASFVGLQQWQPLVGIGMSRYSGVLNVGLDAALSARTSLKLGYDYERGERDQAQMLSAQMVMAL